MDDDAAALAAAEATTAEFRAAGERLDLPAFLQTLTPSVRLRSPISFKARFEDFMQSIGSVAECPLAVRIVLRPHHPVGTELVEQP